MHFTGERMVPGTADRDELFFEHVVRYAFAARHAAGRRVLDAGCGCGYGAHFLRRAGATEVLGVDLDPESIHYSRQHFDHDSLRFAVGDVLELPLPDRSFDLVTCFEVFEHLEAPSRLLAELRRVLRADGVLVVSTPNALTYEADTADGANPFHFREYTPQELQEILAEHFSSARYYVQNPFGGMGIFPMDRSLEASAAVELRVLSPPRESLWGEPREIHAAAEKCAYLIAECGATDIGLEGRLFAMASDLSDTTLERRELDAYVEALTQEYGLLKDQQASSDEWVRDVLDQLTAATAELERLRGERAILEKEHAALEKEYAKQEPWLKHLQQELEEVERGRRELEEHLEKVTGELTESAESRRELEKYLQEVLAGLESEKEARQAAEARCAELEERAPAVDAHSTLEKAERELAALREVHAEHESLEGERKEWALGLQEELDTARRALEEAAVERAQKEKHEEELREWARDLEEDLEKTKADLRETQERAYGIETTAAERASRLDDELRKKSERLESVESAFAELESRERQTGAWAKEKEEEILGIQGELDNLREMHAESARVEDERSEWARGLERELRNSQAEIERLVAERKSLEESGEERDAWARGLESELKQAQAEIERLHAEIAGREEAEQERAHWSRELEKTLVESQAEIERLRAAHEELAKNDAERALWARELERRLIEAGEEAADIDPEPSLTSAG